MVKAASVIEELIMSVILFVLSMSMGMGLVGTGITSTGITILVILSALGAIVYFYVMISLESAGFFIEDPKERLRMNLHIDIENDPDAPPYMKNAARRVSAAPCTIRLI